MSTGVLQSCLLSSMIFTMVVDRIVRNVESQGKSCIQLTLSTYDITWSMRMAYVFFPRNCNNANKDRPSGTG